MSNITYIRLLAGFGYLSLITDAYTHEIIGTQTGECNMPALCTLINSRNKV